MAAWRLGTPWVKAVLKAADGAAKYVEPDQEVFMIPEIESDNVKAVTCGLNRVGADQRCRSGAGAAMAVLDTGVRVSRQDFIFGKPPPAGANL